MPNYGLYSVDATRDLGAIKTSPIYNWGNVWNRTALLYDGSLLCTTSVEDGNTKYGAYQVAGDLIINGQKIALGSDGGFVVSDAGVSFGNVDMLGREKCINITLSDYNTLLSGGLVEGYKLFDQNACYNIVDNVENTDVVDVPELTDVHDRLYNNKYGNLPDNPVTEQTYLNTDAPHISIHGYKFEIEPGEELEVTYMVDTRRGAKCNNLEIGDTFTVIFKDEFGNVLYKNTTYAGVFKVNLSPFMNGANFFEGETWFSAECIDNNGVGSIVTFHDLWIHEPIQWNLYEPTMDELNEYGILPNIESPAKALENKLLLNQLVKDIANGKFGDYNGLKLPKLRTGDTVYHLDPHEENNLPKIHYYVFYTYRSGNSTYNRSKEIRTGGTVDITVDGNTILNYEVGSNESPEDFIRRDGAYICRVSEQDVTDGFAESSDIGKIWVPWRQDSLGYFDSAHEKTGTVRTKDADGNPLTYFPYLRTYTLSGVQNSLGLHYVVSRTGSQTVDPIVLPDNFKLDLNGTALKMTRSVDLQKGNFIDIRKNFNTHICNGRIIGFFDNTDSTVFTYHRFACAASYKYSNDYEALRLLNTVYSRYCTYKDLEISRSLCYESILDSRDDTYTASFCHSGYAGTARSKMTLIFDTVGYIDGLGDGVTIQHPEPIKENVSMAPRLDRNADMSLVCTSGYIDCLEYPDLIKFPNEFVFYIPQNATYACGKQHELFVNFYDENHNYINTVKTELFRVLKKPQSARYMRVTGYGFSELVSGERVVPTYTVEYYKCFTAGEWTVLPENCYDVTVGFELIHGTYFGFTRCCSYIDCTWSNTRNLAFYPAGAKDVLYKGCRWEQIANMSRGASWMLSEILGDIEEGWQLGDGITLIDCDAFYTPEFNEDINLLSIHRHVNNGGTKNFTMINCNGFGIGFGASPDAYFNNCRMQSLSLDRSFMFEHPCTTVRDCIIENSVNLHSDTLFGYKGNGKWDNNTLHIYYGKKVDNPSVGAQGYDHGVFKWNFCDDPVVRDFAITNVSAFHKGKSPISATNDPFTLYTLHGRCCKIGNDTFT